jgi:hypothetical protein
MLRNKVLKTGMDFNVNFFIVLRFTNLTLFGAFCEMSLPRFGLGAFQLFR